MRIKLILVDGTIQFIETQSFALSPVKTMRSEILEACVYADNGKLLAKQRRKNWKHYIKYEYKPEPAPQEPVQEPVAEQPTQEPAEPVKTEPSKKKAPAKPRKKKEN